MRKQLMWINGNGNKLWRILIISCITGLFTVGGWIFVQVRDLPHDYISKLALASIEKQINHKVDKEVLTMINARLRNIEQSVLDLNSFLREYHRGE